MHATVILNPHARQGRAGGSLSALQDFLRVEKLAARVVACDTPQSLETVFQGLAPGTRVVGVGGDGTNHRLLPYLLAGGHSYGIVPLGSGNDVARTLGLLGLTWQDALRHALTAGTRGVDVAVARDVTGDVTNESAGKRARYFLGCFLLGMDAHISNQTQTWKLSGPIPYFFTLLKELPRLRGWDMQLQWDNADGSQQQAQGEMLLCSLLNTPTYGSGYPIAPMAKMDDGVLQLMMARRVGRWKFLDLFFKMLRGQHVHHPDVTFKAVTRVRMHSPGVLCLSADGECIDWQCQGLEVEVLPQRLAVTVAPQGAATP